MKNLIYDLKHSIWEELRDNFLLCIDIGKFNDDLFYGEDIPRVFYDNKVVLPNKIVKKASLLVEWVISIHMVRLSVTYIIYTVVNNSPRRNGIQVSARDKHVPF